MVGKEVGSVWVPKGGSSHGDHCGFPWSLPFATWKMQMSKYQSVCVLVAQSCLTLCDPMDYSLPGSSIQGILQTRILE